jgi:predicted membrane channel-forming protein YqfA (hemolysin III family)
MGTTHASSNPFARSRATLGGIPTQAVDIPICAVLLACYVGLAATHMTIFRRNRAQGRSFKPSVFCFAFCMARVVTFVMRILWATNPTKPSVAIASNVFIAAGVILLVGAIPDGVERGTGGWLMQEGAVEGAEAKDC